ncbi:MAG: hypothetical protein JW789_00845 [Candidatus Aenigmarchaeota archaeon]|nr:hypothetical protein [Candidatus Aenigmarchaeota archaeon]
MVLFCLPCLGLLVYFGIAGIFFPKYRRYIREGWICFTDKLRGKKCAVSFDNRMRLALSTWLTRHRMVRLGRWFSSEKNFSLFMTSVVVISTIITFYFIVLYVQLQINPVCYDGSSCSVDI